MLAADSDAITARKVRQQWTIRGIYGHVTRRNLAAA